MVGRSEPHSGHPGLTAQTLLLLLPPPPFSSPFSSFPPRIFFSLSLPFSLLSSSSSSLSNQLSFSSHLPLIFYFTPVSSSDPPFPVVLPSVSFHLFLPLSLLLWHCPFQNKFGASCLSLRCSLSPRPGSVEGTGPGHPHCPRGLASWTRSGSIWGSS